MRRTVISTLLGCLLMTLVLPLSASGMRGLWVDAFHPGFKSSAEASKMVAKAKECGFNSLFVQVRRRGDVYYRSAIEPMALDVEPGYDPLADVIIEAHAAGMQVHAWITVYEVYHDTKWTKPVAGQVHMVHPEWLMKDDRGKTKFAKGRVYLDPGLPAVREYLVGIVEEIVNNYDVDGIHLDAVRYPGEESGYNEGSVLRFNQENSTHGNPKHDDKKWNDWRRAQVTELVRLVKNTVKSAEKGIELSACVSSNQTDAYFARYQDWPSWLRTGLLDFVVPTVFPIDDRVFKAETDDLLKTAGSKTVYIGQGGWRLASQRSVAQIQMALDAGAPGIVVYSYYYCSQIKPEDNTSLLDTLKSGLFAN